MPYGGEESEEEIKKMERCVKKVQKEQDVSEEEAIKICKEALALDSELERKGDEK